MNGFTQEIMKPSPDTDVFHLGLTCTSLPVQNMGEDSFEDQFPPNMDALKLHWLGTLCMGR